MKSILAGLRTLVLPWLATTGPRMVLGPEVPSVLSGWNVNVTFNAVFLWYYNQTDFFWEGIGTFYGANCFMRGTYDTLNGPYIIYSVFQPVGPSEVFERWGSYQLNAFGWEITTQQANFKIGDGSLNGDFLTVSTNQFLSTDITYNAIAAGGAETWHAAAFTAPWTNRGVGFTPLSYRRIASPPNSVQFVGDVAVNGAANGSQITTLAAGYRPVSAFVSPTGNNGQSGDCVVQVDSAGVVRAFANGGFGLNIQINMVFPLDL